MLSKKIEEALNRQITEEAFSSNLYLAMASWCDHAGLPGSAKFLYQQAEEEKEHMMKLLHYVNDAGGHAVVDEVKSPPEDFKSLTDIFKATLAHEKHITASINRLVDICLDAKDYSTFNFLQWYVSEQHEEEKTFVSILDLIKLAGTEGRGLFLIDKEIGKRSAQRASSQES